MHGHIALFYVVRTTLCLQRVIIMQNNDIQYQLLSLHYIIGVIIINIRNTNQLNGKRETGNCKESVLFTALLIK